VDIGSSTPLDEWTGGQRHGEILTFFKLNTMGLDDEDLGTGEVREEEDA